MLGLEEIVKQSGEASLAIELLKRENLAEKVEVLTEDLPVADEAKTVIEQQLDPETYSSSSYSIDLGYGESCFDSSKYYDMIKGENGETSASMSYNAYEHQFLQEAQQAAQEQKESVAAGKSMSNIDLFVHAPNRDVRMSVKTYSDVVWKLMYDGKLIFN